MLVAMKLRDDRMLGARAIPVLPPAANYCHDKDGIGVDCAFLIPP